jgi:methyl-accepting chemotaxis protein
MLSHIEMSYIANKTIRGMIMLNLGQRAAISKALKVCKAVAEGDFEARILNITETGETGELMHEINRLIDRTDAYLRESKACMQYVSRNQYFRHISEKGMVGAFQSSTRVINQAIDATKCKCDDFSRIASDFEINLDTVVDTVSKSVAELNNHSSVVKSMSESTSEKAITVSAGAEQSSANMQGVAGATEELTSSINEISEQVSLSADTTAIAVVKAGSMGDEIRALQQASEKINDVVQLINDIAGQTNLLALNATIEAARAGEAGKGFAVVASEVKALAAQTETATKTIASQIEDIQKTTRKAVNTNSDIRQTIAQVNEYSSSIASAVEEQGAATREIAQNVNEVASGTSDISSSIGDIQKSTGEMLKTANSIYTASAELTRQNDVLENLRDQMKNFNIKLNKTG